MTEIENPLFDKLVEYIASVDEFYSAVAKDQIRKRSEIENALEKLSKDSSDFTSYVQHRSKSKNESAKVLAEPKKISKKITSTADSILNGVKQGSLSSKTAFRNSVRQNVRPLLKELTESGKGLVPASTDEERLSQKVKDMKTIRQSKAAYSVLNEALKNKQAGDEDSSDNEGNKNDKEAERDLKLYSRYKNKLPTSLRGKLFSVVRMPIVPYMSFKLTAPSFLRKTDIEFNQIAESFVVFEDQYLLAFDYSKIATHGREAEGKRKKKKLTSDDHKSVEDFIIQVIEEINASSPQKFTLASTKYVQNPKNAKIFFAWLLPKYQHDRFANNGSMMKASWGFPWSKDSEALL